MSDRGTARSLGVTACYFWLWDCPRLIHATYGDLEIIVVSVASLRVVVFLIVELPCLWESLLVIVSDRGTARPLGVTACCFWLWDCPPIIDATYGGLELIWSLGLHCVVLLCF